MGAGVLHRVGCHRDTSFARELFLTVIKRNAQAVALYQRLGFQILNCNTTYLGKGKAHPVEWYQMVVEQGAVMTSGDEEDVSLVSTAASSGSAQQRTRVSGKRREVEST